MKIQLILIPFFCSWAFTAMAKTWYVKGSNAYGQNGQSWATAFKYIQQAVDSAKAGDTIKIAAGTYLGYEPSIAKQRFGIRPGSIMLGGYPATGTPTDSDRNPSLYPVILSGEAGSASSIYDNMYHLLEGYNLSPSTVVDGFIIEKACNINSSTLYNNLGAGMHLYNSSGTFRNLVIRNNYASTGGSGICIYGTGSPAFYNCIFTDNTNSNGATIHLLAGTQANFQNCLIVRNNSGNYQPSATIYCNQAGILLNQTTLVNNRIEGDTSNTPALILAENNSSLTVTNSILFNNRVFEYGRTNNGEFYDSIEIRTRGGSTANASYCLIENYSGGTSMLRGLFPRFIDTSSVAGLDGKFFTSDDGFHLRNPCSPALNSGNNTYSASLVTDLAGQPRRFNNGTVDLGPYESQATPTAKPSAVYVNSLATGTNNGTSWTNAYTNLLAAIEDCADTIKIAAGSYFPSYSNTDATYSLQSHTVWLGGYPAIGEPTDADRNPELNPTILDGYLSSFSRISNIVSGKYVDSTTQLNGLQINRSGTAGLKLLYQAAPKLVQVRMNQNTLAIRATGNGNARLEDCRITNSSQSALQLNNRATLLLRRTSISGSGARAVLVTENSSFQADSTRFIKNTGDGALQVLSGSTARLDSCSFLGNSATDGKDIYLQSAAAQFLRCLFSDSSTSYNRYGGSAFLQACAPEFYACSFNRYFGNNGGAIYGDSASPVFRRCVFDSNYSVQGGAALFVRNSQPVFYNCIAIRNNSNNGSFINNQSSRVKLINCTVSRQQSTNLPYAALNVLYNSNAAQTEIRNCIFWANNTSYNSSFTEIADLSGSVTQASNSLFQQFGSTGVSGNFSGINPRLVNAAIPAGKDRIFFTADDGLQLKSCSPAVNAGNNLVADSGILDIAGQPRVFQNTIDAGAYELQETAEPGVAKTIYVNASAASGGTGRSWNTAYNNLQDALANSCADTLKIASGTYRPSLSSRDTSFLITEPKIIWGGYPASGSPADADRDELAYPTILDGNIGNLNDSSDNSAHVVTIQYAKGPVELSKLTIQNGMNQSPNNSNVYGAGIFTAGTRVHLNNCRIRKNTGAFMGGGLAISGGWIQVNRCEFDSNQASRDGGGINFLSVQAGSTVDQSVFYRNQSQMGAGLSFNSGARVTNSLILENKASIRGGGVYVAAQNVHFVNCNFISNASQNDYGGGYYLQQPNYSAPSTNSLNNCLFVGNSSLGGTYYGIDLYDVNCGFDNYCNYRIITNNCVMQTYPYSIYGAPRFLNPSNYRGNDGKWFTSDDGLQLTECSDCINAGNENSYNTDSTDFTGRPRKKLGHTDVGAYEYQDSISGKVKLHAYSPGQLFFAGDTVRLRASGALNYAWDAGYWEMQDSMARYLIPDSGRRQFSVIGYNEPNCPMKYDTATWTIQVYEKSYCPSTRFSLNAGYAQPYYNYHWETDTGTGYHALNDGTVFNGTLTGTLDVLQPDSIPYGSKFRCLITQDPQPSFYGNVYTIRFADTFYGSADGDWYNIDNWGCYRIPPPNVDVFVVPGQHPLIINTPVSCHSLNIQFGATVNMAPGGTVQFVH